MSYFKIAACAAILMSGMASVNSALAGNKGGVSASAPGQQMRLATPPPSPGAGGLLHSLLDNRCVSLPRRRARVPGGLLHLLLERSKSDVRSESVCRDLRRRSFYSVKGLTHLHHQRSANDLHCRRLA